jgi:hypothetical protein
MGIESEKDFFKRIGDQNQILPKVQASSYVNVTFMLQHKKIYYHFLARVEMR